MKEKNVVYELIKLHIRKMTSVRTNTTIRVYELIQDLPYYKIQLTRIPWDNVLR